MTEKHSLKTAEGREAARDEHYAAISKLKDGLEQERQKLDRLVADNQGNIDARSALAAKIRSKRSTGKAMIVIGIILAIGGGAVAYLIQPMLYGIAGAAVGLLLFLLGIIVFNGWKKYQDDYESANKALTSFDSKEGELSDKIAEYEQKIASHRQEINEIDLAEKYAEVDEWIDSIATGYMGLYATSETNLFDPTPAKPTAKKYKSYTLQSAHVYINEMRYGSVVQEYSGRAFDVFEVDEVGTQKVEIVVNYKIGDSEFTRQTDPVPVKFDKCSKFVWCHVSTCQKGTQVFWNSYDKFEDFLKDTGITKDELLDKIR